MREDTSESAFSVMLISGLISFVRRRLSVSGRSVALFRIWLGWLTALECLDRASVAGLFYTDGGAMPRWAVLPAPEHDRLLWLACVHAWSGSLAWQLALLSLQAGAGLALACGVQPKRAAALAWLLHLSLTLRNASLNYILDRYLHVLLFLVACLPSDQLASSGLRRASRHERYECSAASVALGLQLLVIYVDAGTGKLRDPAGAWSVGAPVAALDTYLRHTPAARLARRLLGAAGLRYAGAATAWAETLLAPLALVAGGWRLRRGCVCGAIALHVGIALTVRNTELLSLAAIAAWLPWLEGPPPPQPPPQPPPPQLQQQEKPQQKGKEKPSAASQQRPPPRKTASPSNALSAAMVAALGGASALHQYRGGGAPSCGAHAPAGELLVASLLHNRWNVFTSAEPHVVWEVAPARLSTGEVVDLWRLSDSVSWEVPVGAPPARRRGRWRSWPYLAQRDDAADAAFWGALCDEWERHDAARRTVVGFHFYMLQADIVPTGHEGDEEEEPAYGEVRKRLVRAFSCEERA